MIETYSVQQNLHVAKLQEIFYALSSQLSLYHTKDRIVPFPKSFKEILGLHIDNSLKKNAKYLFESNRRTKFTDRGVRKIMQKYTELAGIKNSISPHTLRHFLFTWLKKKGIDDALIQPYSGHDSRLSLEMYSKLSLSDCQDVYDSKIKDFPF